MVNRISPEALNSLLSSNSQFALIDVREAGEYNSSHIPGSTSLPRRLLEFNMLAAVPFGGALVVVCDDDERRARSARHPGVRLERGRRNNTSRGQPGRRQYLACGSPGRAPGPLDVGPLVLRMGRPNFRQILHNV